MSNATAISDHDIEKRTSRRHRPYLQPLKAVEAQVAVLQEELKVQRQQHHDALERNLVLAELNHTQERLQAIYNKHVQWLQCPDTAQQSCAVSSTPAGLPLDGSNAAEPWAVQDARWVMFCLDTASKEQVQQALTMTSADWSTFQRQLCEDLTSLMEIDKRSPEVQRTMLGELMQGGAPAPKFPAAYAFSRLSEPAAAPGDGAVPEFSSPAFKAIVQRLTQFSTLALIVLLHGLPCIMEASSRNLHTGETGHPPSLHWVEVAARLRFSRQQKLQFKCALENFTRQLRANAGQQNATLQQTPSYAFLLASRTITARESSAGGAAADALTTAGRSSSNIPEQPVVASVAELVMNRTGAAGLFVAAAPASAPVTVSSDDAHNWREQSGGASPGPGPTLTAEMAAAGGAAAVVPAPMAGLSAAGQGSCSAGDVSTPALPDEDEVQAVVKAVGECALSHELQHQMGLFYQHVVTVTTFLADSLTLEQTLLLNVASYPFWPLIHLVASAAIQLPDEPEIEVTTDGFQHDIQLLMLHRHRAMLDAHCQVFGDHSTPCDHVDE